MICTKCKKTVRVIAKFLDEQLNNALEIAGEITNEVAKAVDNPLFQFLVSQIPHNANTDAVLKTIETTLSQVARFASCEGLTGVEKINCLISGLNILPKSERNSVLLRLHSALAATADGNRFEPFVYDTAAQLNYFDSKIKKGIPVEVTADKNSFIEEAAIVNETVVSIAEEKVKPQIYNDFPHAMPFNEKVTGGSTPTSF